MIYYVQSQKRQILISPEATTRCSSSSSKKNLPSVSCNLLRNKCIFCDKEVKQVKRKREFLRKCVAEQAKCKILQHGKEINDIHLTALASTNDLIAAEAQHHLLCYRDYTRLVTGKKVVEKSDYQKLELEAFHKVIKGCRDIICTPNILKFEELLLIMKNYFLKNRLSISQSTKNNLRRNIEKCFGDQLEFISVRGTLFLHPSVMSVEQVIMTMQQKQQEQLEKKLSVRKTKCLGLLNRAILNQKNLRLRPSRMSF